MDSVLLTVLLLLKLLPPLVMVSFYVLFQIVNHFLEKFGKWSVSWSKCNSKCKQYKARKCLQAPCPKTQLYQFRDCPAEENQNIPACSSSGAAKPGERKPHIKTSPHFLNQHLECQIMLLFQYSSNHHTQARPTILTPLHPHQNVI